MQEARANFSYFPGKSGSAGTAGLAGCGTAFARLRNRPIRRLRRTTMFQEHIRWLIQPDLDKVLAIEESLAEPWTEEDFRSFSQHRNSIGMVIEVDEQVLGYMAYELLPRRLELIRLAIHPRARRQGLGRQLLARLENKLVSHQRSSIGINVSEWDTPTHLWLKACGFEAIRVIPGPKEDSYRFVYRLPEVAPVPVLAGDVAWL
jgi:ribosomal protein S18 acetylase RimI-like enzyme